MICALINALFAYDNVFQGKGGWRRIAGKGEIVGKGEVAGMSMIIQIFKNSNKRSTHIIKGTWAQKSFIPDTQTDRKTDIYRNMGQSPPIQAARPSLCRAARAPGRPSQHTWQGWG